MEEETRALTDEEAEQFSAALGTFLSTLIRQADDFGYDRDSYVGHAVDVLRTISELSTFAQYEEGSGA